MDSGTLASLDWGAVALMVLIGGAFVWALSFFLRQNRQDLDSLEETLKSESEDDEAG